MILKRLKNTYFVSGIIFFAIFILVGILRSLRVLYLSWGSEVLVGTVLFWGGIILIVIGILKAIFGKSEQ